MASTTHFLAVDLGATSGRTILGTLHEGHLEMEELTRFDNPIIEATGHCYWDLLALYHEVVGALQLVHQRHIDLQSIGIDTWGCDFVFVAPDGQILANPMAYRDPHTAHAMDTYFAEVLPRQTVYDKTGIQFMNFNSLFQLHQMRRDGNTALQSASKVLFIPDALNYLLTGQAVCEYTVASTSQLLNPATGDLDPDLLASVGLSRQQFGPMTEPGTPIGCLTPALQRLTGLGPVPVVAVAGHDTAAAVAAVPARDRHFAYLSSGTWSLMGIETPHAIIDDRSFDRNFTNEGGIEGTTRFLKNICGMWIYERCRKEWPEAQGVSHADLQQQAMQQPAFRSLINPDDPAFANPASMTDAIRDYCVRTQQPVPDSPAAFCRCIFDSLALRYRQVFAWLKEFADFDISALHIIGGGSRNEYLDQFTANACRVSVLAGPQEATAIGNLMLQAKAAGCVTDVWQMRHIIADSTDMHRFEPHDAEAWDAAYARWLQVTGA